MAIPKNITVEKINQAIAYIDEHGFPDDNQSKKYDLITSSGKKYPPKYVIAVARAIENHAVVEDKIIVKGFDGTEAWKKLDKLGFKIEKRGKKERIVDIPDFNEYETDITEVEIKQLEGEKFTIIFDKNSSKSKTNQRKPSFVARKIDFDYINAAKRKIGALGEEIVFGELKQQAEESCLQTPIHASKEEGDGLGYDIRAFDKQGNEIHIEVKASKSKNSGGFEMTQNEVKASIKHPEHYKVYYVYAIDIDTKNCRIKIYDGPFTDELYKMEPTGFKVSQK